MVLERCQGNKRRACDILDISYHTLQSHLDYGERAGGRGRAAVASERHENKVNA